MAQIITENFRVFNATRFVEYVVDTNNLYLFIGRPQSWDNEPTAPTPVNVPYQDTVYWADAVALKRIVPNDFKQVVERKNWSAGIVYSQYDNASSTLYGSNFYVLTQDNNVYKCISNNFGAASSIKPTGTSTNIITTSDNYRWKYLYSLTDTDLLKFLTNDYMPVNLNYDVLNTAIKGTIDNFVVTNIGSNYSVASNISVNILGDGLNARIGNVVLSGANTIDRITLNTSGSGYTFANLSILDSGGGSNATARAIVSPINGHGADVLTELGARYVMINTRLNYAEGGGDFPVVNDYRRIGIVKNPISNATSTMATETTLDATITLNLSNVTGTFALDEYIRGDNTNSNAFIVSANANVSSGNVTIRYITPIELFAGNIIFSAGETIRGANSLAVGTISTITPAEVKKNTGQILYVENRAKITRASDQAENIHIVIEF
jgi:hypothetical protein